MLEINAGNSKAVLDSLLSVWDKQFPLVLGCGAAVVFGGFVAARIIFRRLPPDSYGAKQQPSLRMAPTEEEKRAVAPACLQAIESRLREAGVPELLIPWRLRDASQSLARLRARLVKVKPDAVALIDCGDFDAAVAILKQSCEPDTDLDEGCCEPGQAHQAAEIYADAALIDQLKLDYRSAAENFAAAATLVSRFGDPASKGQEEWRLRIEQGHALVDDGLQTGNGGSFISAIATYDQALSLVPRREAPFNWAATQFHRGDALLASGVNDNETERFEEAVESFRAALEEWTPEPAPFDWARAQHNLGEALQRLAEIEPGVERLQPAVEAYRAALREWTREAAPDLFAMVQSNLGDALAIMGVRATDKTKLREAVDAYRAALGEMRREIAPKEWAMIQRNLGNALEALAEQEDRDQIYGFKRLAQAVEAFEAARDGQSPETSPVEFAAASVNLADALLALGEREFVENPDYGASVLQRAATAYRDALAGSDAISPVDVARVKVNLAYALGLIWNKTRDRPMLDEALAMLDAAIPIIKDTKEKQHVENAERARETVLAALAREAA